MTDINKRPVLPTADQMKELGMKDAIEWVEDDCRDMVAISVTRMTAPILAFLAWEAESSPFRQTTDAEISELVDAYQAGLQEVIKAHQSLADRFSRRVIL